MFLGSNEKMAVWYFVYTKYKYVKYAQKVATQKAFLYKP